MPGFEGNAAVQYGLGIPTCREGLAYPSGFADLATIAEMAREAERLGFDALWGNDHLATQRVVMDTLPEPPSFYEPLITFAYLAGQTTRIRLVVGTVVAPLRATVLLAKQAATLDRASGGRLVLGLGIGAYREEFEAIANPPPKANRGRWMEETVQALRLLFEQRRAGFAGRYVRFDEIEVYPKPVQRPLPLYLSGNSPDAVRRAGRLADGLIVAGLSPEQAREQATLFRAAAREAGRDPQGLAVCAQVWVGVGESAGDARDTLERSQHFRRIAALAPDADREDLVRAFTRGNLLGSADEIATRIAEYAAAGVDHLALIFLAQDVADLLRGARLFGREIIGAPRGTA